MAEVKGELMQAEKETGDAKKLAEKNKDKQCFYCQKKGHVKSDCRNRQRDMKKAKTQASRSSTESRRQ